MKTINKYITEKFRVSKDYKVDYLDDANNEFYKTFEKDFQKMSSDNKWEITDSVKFIYSIKIIPHYKMAIDNKIHELIPKARSMFYCECSDSHYKQIWQDMFDWINNHENDMEFLMNDNIGKGIYKVRLFETSKHVIGLFGDTSMKYPVIVFVFK